jgi:hypothetical protein
MKQNKILISKSVRSKRNLNRFFPLSVISLGACIFSAAFIPFQFAAASGHWCKIEPFSQHIKAAGETANFAVTLFPSSPIARVDVQTGSLPQGIQTFFGPLHPVSPARFETTAAFTAGERAEPGSFTISVIYREISGGTIEGEKNAVCRLNLVIDSGAASSASSAVSASSPSPPPSGFFSPGSSAGRAGSRDTDRGATAAPNPGLSGDTEKRRSIETSGFSSSGFVINLRRGDRNNSVRQLQELLAKLGFFPKSIEPTGFFGPLTERAVKSFQAVHNIQQTGRVGPVTRSALNDILGK